MRATTRNNSPDLPTSHSYPYGTGSSGLSVTSLGMNLHLRNTSPHGLWCEADAQIVVLPNVRLTGALTTNFDERPFTLVMETGSDDLQVTATVSAEGVLTVDSGNLDFFTDGGAQGSYALLGAVANASVEYGIREILSPTEAQLFSTPPSPIASTRLRIYNAVDIRNKAADKFTWMTPDELNAQGMRVPADTFFELDAPGTIQSCAVITAATATAHFGASIL